MKFLIFCLSFPLSAMKHDISKKGKLIAKETGVSERIFRLRLRRLTLDNPTPLNA